MEGTPDISRAVALMQQDTAVGDPDASIEVPFPGRAMGFCLVMKLRFPTQIGELLDGLENLGRETASADATTATTKNPTESEIDRRLKALKYVHYSRFVPLIDRGELLIVTEFDGNQQDYVMDFAAVLDQEFSFILSFMEDAPPLPVREHPEAFYDYVQRYTTLVPGKPAEALNPVGPLEGRSVLDVLGDDVYSMHNPRALQPTPQAGSAGTVGGRDLSDIQANVVKGFAAQHVRHYFVRFPDDPASCTRLLRHLGTAISSHGGGLHSHCLNVGLTFKGLQALDLPHDICRRFPGAFTRGPWDAKHAFTPGIWPTRLTQEGEGSEPVHAVISLSIGAKGDPQARQAQGEIETLLAESTSAWSFFDAERLDRPDSSGAPIGDDMLVHFGFRDGISQPKIHGIPHGRRKHEEFDSVIGDFVLGHPNSRGGDYLNDLPVELAKNATYSAFMAIDQEVEAFEARGSWKVEPAIMLSAKARAALYAEKLLGRKPDGRPAHMPDSSGGPARNRFDFWESPAGDPDQRGSACPFGAHIRRMNPRHGVVVGVPTGRRIIRRGMPYGARFNPGRPVVESRGLVGHFFCGDLQEQYEFLQRVWGSGDVSAPGLRATRDPFASTRSIDTPFKFEWSPKGKVPQSYTLMVPPLVSTRFATYLFMPGKRGLQWLAGRSWEDRPPVQKQDVHVGPIGLPVKVETLDPLDRRFMQTPHRFYAALRGQQVISVGPPYCTRWALSYGAVSDALRSPVVIKPGLGRGPAQDRPAGMAAGLKDGLFFADPERHAQIRERLNPAFPAGTTVQAHANAPGAGAASLDVVWSLAQARADALLDAAEAKGVFDIVSDFAAPLTTQVFMQVMGIPQDILDAERGLVEAWVRSALAGHDAAASQDLQVGGLTASMALRAYFMALGQCPAQNELHPSIMDAIRGNMGTESKCGVDLAPDEALNTGLQFALGGFLSTQFLITTGTYNLLLHASEWDKLKADRSEATMDRAVAEMLRFDSPFMMADRWVAEGTSVAGFKLERDTKLTLVYGSANRDPDYFENPERFDISADRANRHLAFGGDSPYNCIGRFMAQWIAAVAFRSLIDRFPSASIAEVGPWLTDPYYRSLSRLTVYTR